MLHWCKNSRPYLPLIADYWISAKRTPQNNFFSGQILTNCCYNNWSRRNARFTKLWSHDHIRKYNLSHIIKLLLVMSRTKIMVSQPFYQNTFVLGRPKVCNFAEIIINTTTFIKATFKDPKKVKRIWNCVLKYNLYFPDIQSILLI